MARICLEVDSSFKCFVVNLDGEKRMAVSVQTALWESFDRDSPAHLYLGRHNWYLEIKLGIGSLHKEPHFNAQSSLRFNIWSFLPKEFYVMVIKQVDLPPNQIISRRRHKHSHFPGRQTSRAWVQDLGHLGHPRWVTNIKIWVCT